MLAVDIANEERLVAVMDIGTNTELILGNKHKCWRPHVRRAAFEGGKISCAMPGLPGAIEKIEIHDGGAMTAAVIGDGPAQGVCGSGLVDLLSELLRTGRMNALGRFEEDGRSIALDCQRSADVFQRKRCQRTGASQGRERRRICTSSFRITAFDFRTLTYFIWPEGSGVT